MKVIGQDLVTVELAVSKKSYFVRDCKVLLLVELIAAMPTEQRSVHGALRKSLIERRLELLS